MMLKSAAAGPVGRRRSCSQFCSVFTLTPNADGSTEFAMTEEFSGLMLPMIKGSLPDFAPVFETYAADLKCAAEGK